MPNKKEQQAASSQPDQGQIQVIMEQYHQLADALHASQDQQQAEAALAAINALTEATQLALLKVLSKESHSDAADIVTALNELSPLKSVRKEARRSLIRLQELRIYPVWNTPIVRTSAFDQLIEAEMVGANTPTRFWKGYVTDSKDAGEVQLLLVWEQGAGYKDVRVLGFLLEFWHDGVKDFFTRVESKRAFERLVAEMQAKVTLLDCSLAKGRSLIEEALAVNKNFGTKPHRDFTRHRAMLDSMILQNPEIPELEEEEDEEEIGAFIDRDLEPFEVVTEFIDAWADQDFELAYNYLAEDSSLRAGLSEEEWAAQREEWADVARPKRLLPNFVHEREVQKSGLWLPNPFNRSTASTNKVVDTGWSLELAENEQSISLPELPQATAVYKETGRRWFWTSYTLAQEEDGWRIQSMTDEGVNNQQLSIDELQRRVQDHESHLREITSQHQPTDPDADQYLDEIVWRSMQMIYYEDALLKQLPLDQSIYMDAAGRAIILGEIERGLVYLEQAAEKFPEQRADILRQVAALQMQLSDDYYAEDDDYYEEEDEEEETEQVERGEHFEALAEETLRESLRLEKNVLSHLLLAQLLIDSGEEDKLDEAEDQLHQAQTLTLTPSEEASIESTLGTVYMQRDEYARALDHYQRAVAINADLPGGWYNVGDAYRHLEQVEDAIAAFQRSIELHPDDIDSYAALSEIYMQNGQIDQARTLLEGGLEVNPESLPLLVMLSSTYLDSDIQRAEELLEEAESIDPDHEMVLLYRQMLELQKLQQRSRKKAPQQHSHKRSSKKK